MNILRTLRRCFNEDDGMGPKLFLKMFVMYGPGLPQTFCMPREAHLQATTAIAYRNVKKNECVHYECRKIFPPFSQTLPVCPPGIEFNYLWSTNLFCLCPSANPVTIDLSHFSQQNITSLKYRCIIERKVHFTFDHVYFLTLDIHVT